MLDVKSAVSGLEKMLKTGIVAASKESNVQSSESFVHRDSSSLLNKALPLTRHQVLSPNKLVKNKIRALYADWLINGRHEFMPSNRMKRSSPEDFTGWVKDAWCTILSAMVIKAFKNYF
ncbi:hypothetical protein HPB52_023596 [Rhipicephalus sanguineus]|uniref:Uncharacterized protein n=1 Tax=Rhipicephalus sanguineus TaxID=34632 RepID=A0A9D4PRT5_RHISA|nr:hypothetical protein HPB52_023596 [Rhipicephalus sanguineus]